MGDPCAKKNAGMLSGVEGSASKAAFQGLVIVVEDRRRTVNRTATRPARMDMGYIYADPRMPLDISVSAPTQR